MSIKEQALSIFGYPIWVSEEIYNFNDKELDYIKNLPTIKNGGGGGNSMSIDDYLFKNKEMSNIKNFCQKQIDKYFYELMNVEDQIKIYTTQAWANYNKKSEEHHSHLHANSIVSAVLYVQTDGVKIQFQRDNARELWPMLLRYKDFDYYNASSWWVESELGKIIIFPSKLVHNVEENKGETERISIAINTFVKGYLGDDLAKAGLRL